jgi:hypothetical protein
MKLHKCSLCAYVSDKISNYKRHVSVKHPDQNILCENPQQEILPSNPEILPSNPEILPQNPEILPLDTGNPTIEDDTCSGKKKCTKCYKLLASQKTLQAHIKLCKGISNPFECTKCHIILANSGSKSRHMKTCKGLPLVIPKATPTTTSQVAHTINNTVNNITNPNYTINIISYNNENILFNDKHIATKDLKQIFNGPNKKSDEAIVQYGNKLLEQPENRCVRKKHITSSYCETYAGDGKWETRPDTNVIDRFSQDIAISANDRLYDHPTIGRKELRDEIAELASFPADVHSKAINLRREIRAMLVNTSNDVNKN